MSYEPKSLSDYLVDMRTGGSGRRWHAAFQLSKRLANQQGLGHPEQGEPARETGGEPVTEEFVRSLLDLREASALDDPRLPRYLTLCLAYVEGPGVQEVLLEALGDPDEDMRLYAVWAEAIRRDASAVGALIDMLPEESGDMRKAIAYALGTIGDWRAVNPLRALLQDERPDVRWNAALALARFGDEEAVPVLKSMLDREYLQQQPGMNERQREQVLINAIRASSLLQETPLMAAVKPLADNDTSLKVRQAALEALSQ